MESNIRKMPDSIGGVRFREVTGSDAEAMASIHSRRRERDGVDAASTFESIPTVDQVAGWLTWRSSAEMVGTLIGAEVDGRIVGYTWLDWWTEKDGVRLYLSQAVVDPAYRGLGVGTSMVRWAEETLRRKAMDDGGLDRAFYGANAAETERDATSLLIDHGYVESFAVVEMLRDSCEVDDFVLPAGVELRPLLEEHLLEVGRSVTAAYAESVFSVEVSEQQDETQVKWLRGFDPSLCFVAWAGDQVAGQVICRVERGRVELAEVSVGKEWRRRGIASGLISSALRNCHEIGVPSARLHTVRENRYASIVLYEGLGFRVIKKHLRYRKPMD